MKKQHKRFQHFPRKISLNNQKNHLKTQKISLIKPVIDEKIYINKQLTVRKFVQMMNNFVRNFKKKYHL